MIIHDFDISTEPIATVFAGVGSWNEGDIDMIWVDEPYRYDILYQKAEIADI